LLANLVTRVYASCFIKNRYGTQDMNDETWWIPPGSASVIESIFPEEGIFVGVDHAMADVVKGGAVAVLAANNSTATDHPESTWVPPKGSPVAAGNTTAAAATTNATCWYKRNRWLMAKPLAN
jgi:hypothetical protein